ncbi:MAG: glycosyl hydrolase family 17 protein [Bacteroidota bacterium]
MTAKEILGNPDYQAISYGGYRQKSRDIQPTIPQLKEDMKLLDAMGIHLIRTYNVHLAQAANLLEAIRQLNAEDPNFKMYVMLGAWIDCAYAWLDWRHPDHFQESERNPKEVAEAVRLAQEYPDVVKIIAIGNEAMIRWAAAYYVQPHVILKYVNQLQEMKQNGELPADLWITCSDDFASWGGGDPSYHNEDLVALIKAVDFISMHTYPFHNSHYNPQFWHRSQDSEHLTEVEAVDAAMVRARDFAINHYKAVKAYMESQGVNKPIHIGETGWASLSDGLYGPQGSQAADQYKQARYYHLMREWTNAEGIACFFFEAFDEPWKDAGNPIGSENHFGLFTVTGEAKYALWDLVDQGTFEGLTRDENPILKTFKGEESAVLETVTAPPIAVH